MGGGGPKRGAAFRASSRHRFGARGCEHAPFCRVDFGFSCAYRDPKTMRIDWNQYQPSGFYDELFAGPGEARPSAAQLADYLASLGARELADRQADAERAIVEMGITFTVYTEGQNIDRAWPFDV